MLANGERPSDFAAEMQHVSHVHISEPGLAPIRPRALHKELALLLGAVGYQGFVSLEMKAAPWPRWSGASTMWRRCSAQRERV